MAYQQYRTEAIVLRSFSAKEADKVLVLFAREFGLLYVRAVSLREEKSRQRYSLQDLSLANVGIVRGKGGWRLVGASLTASHPREEDSMRTYARLASMVVSLVHGEERNDYLFNTLEQAHGALSEGTLPPQSLEIICAVKILYALGYFSPDESQKRLLEDAPYTAELCACAESMRKPLVRGINNALRESQLIFNT